MAKRGPRRLKIGVQSRFGPNSTVEKFWGGLMVRDPEVKEAKSHEFISV